MGRASRAKSAKWKEGLLRVMPAEARRSVFPPRKIFRFLAEEAFAEDLCAGRIYLSTLNACRNYEDRRRGDPHEGRHEYRVAHAAQGRDPEEDFQFLSRRVGIEADPNSGVVIHNAIRIARMPDAYVICCTARYSPQDLGESFGRFCVEIRDSVRFFAEVSRVLQAELGKVAHGEIAPVVYRDRTFVGQERDVASLGFVKPRDIYAPQQEVRMLWRMEDGRELAPKKLNVPVVATICRRRK